jgi:hypothetical protein
VAHPETNTKKERSNHPDNLTLIIETLAKELSKSTAQQKAPNARRANLEERGVHESTPQ